MTHPAVQEAAVIGQEDEVIVLKPGYTPSEQLADEFRQFVKSTPAPYKYPRWIRFVAALPRTATGKLQRFKLRQA